MSHTLKKVLYSLSAAAVTAAVGGLFCLFSAKPAENGRAVILFTEAASQSSVVDTEISRSVSALRRTVTDEDFLKMAAVGSEASANDIKEALSVARLGNSSGAEVILSGLERPSEAPIILMNILCLAENSSEVPEFKVISGCDLSFSPQLPMYNIIAGAGLAGGLFCFIAVSAAGGGRKSYYRPEKADTNNDYQSALFMQKYIEDACKAALNLGTLPLSAPEGLEKSGYIEAARQLSCAAEKCSARIIAVAPDSHRTSGEIPPAAKIASYLACALAETGKRTVIIDCMINSPYISKIFRLSPIRGLSDFTRGGCAVWDILTVNARRGVDVICQKKVDTPPAEVFSAGEYERLLEYLAHQYDNVLLCAPRAWDCNEWGSLTRRCRGYVVVLGGENVSADIAREIMGQKNGFIALCRAEKSVGDTAPSEKK